ncbi:hypothetical protein G9A89_015506 [Geosiphon pyriformis]|nr:hypothetical protein G9A89_015506 [Geosiphon pyriformis]
MSYWFILVSKFMHKSASLEVRNAVIYRKDMLNVLNSDKFYDVHNSLLEMWSNCIKIYTDKFLKDASSIGIVGGIGTYFLAIDASIGISVARLLSSILTELQAVALALKYVLFLCSVVLYLDNQSVINAYLSETIFVALDFCNQCWIKRLQIVNLLKNKDVSIK